jgi:hypothetical protein
MLDVVNASSDWEVTTNRLECRYFLIEVITYVYEYYKDKYFFCGFGCGRNCSQTSELLPLYLHPEFLTLTDLGAISQLSGPGHGVWKSAGLLAGDEEGSL